MKSMNQIKQDLLERKEGLKKTQQFTKNAISKLPQGRLRVTTINEKARYYVISKKNDTNGKYVSTKDIAIIRDLANRSYYEKLLKQIDSELAALEKAIIQLDKCGVKLDGTLNYSEGVFSTICDNRKRFVTPVLLDDDEFVLRWTQKSYKKNEYRSEEKIYPTKKGDLVRSKSESMIADMYYDLNVPYRYEAEVCLNNGICEYPDFTILDRVSRNIIYHEHLGLMDDRDYRYRSLKKINNYRKSGIYTGKNLILTYEAEGSVFNIRDLERSTKEMLGIK